MRRHSIIHKPDFRVLSRLGNIYLLLALAAIAVLYTTTEAKVVRNYAIALWIVDITHIVVTAYGLGMERTLDVGNWNSMTWGNVGITVSNGLWVLEGQADGKRVRLFSVQREVCIFWVSLVQTGLQRQVWSKSCSELQAVEATDSIRWRVDEFRYSKI